jgi:hypothetical protein
VSGNISYFYIAIFVPNIADALFNLKLVLMLLILITTTAGINLIAVLIKIVFKISLGILQCSDLKNQTIF